MLKKTLASLKKNGLSGTIRRIINHMKIRRELKKLKLIQNAHSRASIPYDSEYQEDQDFSDYSTDIKALAFYLPQFHTIPENDGWWGKGFTEWSNTCNATPKYRGHYQPREPHDDIGYYDLSEKHTLSEQVKLAKKHGIYGFCFYYYWFSGKRLLEKPVDFLLENPEIDINFCLCWANENWTRAWDGHNDEILIKQEYNESDACKFIEDIKRYTDDARYIRIDNKPVIVVYNPGQIPDISKVFHAWRERAKVLGIGDILIWTCQTDNNTAKNLKITEIIDVEIEFPPHNMWYNETRVSGVDIFDAKNATNANVFNYKSLVEIVRKRIVQPGVPLYRTAMLGWDNTARRKTGWTSYYGYSLKSFHEWLEAIIGDVRRRFPKDERFIFINAWNEWAEGTYLEPDKKYGYAGINTLSKALFSLPFEECRLIRISEFAGTDIFESKTLSEVIDSGTTNEKMGVKARIAVQAHIFYVEVLDEMLDNLSNIPYKFDLYITTDSEKKRIQINDSTKAKNIKSLNKLTTEIYENRGRDVAPFIIQLGKHIGNYEYICHIHSKRTCGNLPGEDKDESSGDALAYGDDWRKYLLMNLLGSSDYVREVINLFERSPNLGIVFPETYPKVLRQAEWGSNEYGAYNVLSKLGVSYILPDEPIFPVGNMFWARTDAIKPVFTAGFDSGDFPKDRNQEDATLAHQIERLWVYIADSRGYSYLNVENGMR